MYKNVLKLPFNIQSGTSIHANTHPAYVAPSYMLLSTSSAIGSNKVVQGTENKCPIIILTTAFSISGIICLWARGS